MANTQVSALALAMELVALLMFTSTTTILPQANYQLVKQLYMS